MPLQNSPPRAHITFLFYSILVVFGFLVFGGAVLLHEHGYFVRWINLGNPILSPQTGEKVDKILGADTRSIRVGTNHARAFETDLPWIAWGSTPKDFPWQWHEVRYETLKYSGANFGCPYSFWVPPLLPKLVIKAVDQVQVKDCRMLVGIEQANYLILANGKVWVWEAQKYW